MENDKILNNFSTFVVIETSVLLDRRLSSTDKILYGYISVLENNEKKKCFCSNTYLATLMNLEARTIQRAIAKLKYLNYVNVEYEENTRYINTAVKQFVEKREEKNKYQELFEYNWLKED